MRDTDIQHFASATRTSSCGDSQALVLEALGIPLPNLERLEMAVRNDLSTNLPYRIWRWEDSIPSCHRIAIVDQLYSCVESVSANLIEAQLHWFEFLDWMERANELVAVHCPPRNRNALEILIPRVKSMYEGDVIRSLCSSLDCLSGAIIVITALKLNVLRADFVKVRNELRKIHGSKTGESMLDRRLQSSFANDFEKLIVSSGPKDWVDWMHSYRNMVVHRGRRLSCGQFIAKNEGNALEQPRRFRWINHLQIDPNRPPIEDLRGQESSDDSPLRRSLLEEDSKTTITGLLESTITLVESTSNSLFRIWTIRRNNPSQVVQPKSQWTRTAARTQFPGYNPREHKIPRKRTSILANPVLGTRLRAASLGDESRKQWETLKSNS